MRCGSECGGIQLSDTRNGFQKLVGKRKLSRKQGDRIESKTTVPIRCGSSTVDVLRKWAKTLAPCEES